MQTNLEITVDGRWLSLESMPGDIQMTTSWPGGSEQLSWTPGTLPYRRFHGDELVAAYLGGFPVWSGSLLEPDPSQDQMTAQGAYHEGEEYGALTTTFLPGNGPDQCIDNAIGRGLRWTRPASLSNTATDIDTSSGPVKLGELLDTWATNNGTRWAVNPNREVFAADDPTTPSYQILGIEGGLGYALDDYASTLFGRYLDSTTSTYQTVGPVSDDLAEQLHGYDEDVVDLTGRGAITSAKATTFTQHILNLGRSTPQWTSTITVSYGELLSMGGTPVPLEIVAAGTIVRVHGGFELAQRQNQALYVDVLIGQTSLSGGLLTLTPMQIASRTFQDIITDALTNKRPA
jgi:hypothetical protein